MCSSDLAWITATVVHRLRLDAGRAAIAEWEREHGELTPEELADGLARAERDPELRRVTRERLTLVCADAAHYLAGRATPPDVVYLDPMFPERTGSTVAKKELRLLGMLAADAEDADALFVAALRSGATRIVVKRPRLAPPLEAPGAPPVTTRLLGRSSRFDVYVLPRSAPPTDAVR